MRTTRDTALLPGLGLVLLPGYLALRPALAVVAQRQVAALFIVYGALFLLYLAAGLLVLRGAVRGRGALAAALGLALLFRLILLPTLPTLSGDPYRYVWDARLLTHHLSPYMYAPAEDCLRFLRDHVIYPHMGWYSVPTLYPPGAQYLFALTFLLSPNNVVAMKVMLLATEALTVAGLMLLLRARGDDPARVLLYAWNPLAVVEVAGSGHIDAAAAAAIVLALLAERRGRPAVAGALIGVATLCKLFPLVLLIALDRRDLRRAVPAALATILAGYLPFVLTNAHPIGYLGTYVADQDFNQWLYLPAHLAAQESMRHLLHALPLAALVVVLAVVAWRRWRGGLDTATASLLALGAILFFSPSLFPWYLLTVLPLTALGPWRGVSVGTARGVSPPWLWRTFDRRLPLYLALLALSGTVIWSYRFFTLGIPIRWLGMLEWLPVYLLLAVALMHACMALMIRQSGPVEEEMAWTA